jgi:Flp pilus assembly pilin Flp
MFDFIKRVLRDEAGLSAIEYSMFAALFAVIMVSFLFQQMRGR